MTLRAWKVAGAATLGVLTLGACGADDTGDSDSWGEVSYSEVQTIWDQSCEGSGCHVNGGTSGGLALDDGVSHGNLVGQSAIGAAMNLVVAGSAEDSYLWHKLKETQDEVGGSGSVMPVTGSLSDSDLSVVRAWISSGAAED